MYSKHILDVELLLIIFHVDVLCLGLNPVQARCTGQYGLCPGSSKWAVVYIYLFFFIKKILELRIAQLIIMSILFIIILLASLIKFKIIFINVSNVKFSVKIITYFLKFFFLF